MNTTLIIGGSKGIGSAILNEQLNTNTCINISRTAPEASSPNLTHHSADVLADELPTLEKVDALVYCPGSITLKPISTLKEEHFINDFKINVWGAVRVIKQYLPLLRKGHNPSITLFSTVAVAQGMPFHASVASAKAGVEGLMKSLAAELAPTIRVNCIAPTITETDLAAGLLKNEKMKENTISRHPLKKILTPADVAHLAQFLITDKVMTGQVLGLDAGLSSLKV